MAKRIKIYFICFSLLIGTAIGVLTAEIFLRIRYKVPLATAPIGSLIDNPDIGILNKPNYTGYFRTAATVTKVSINEQGLRDHPRDYKKPLNTIRVLALGDSYVWGHGVEYEELFLTVAENQLNEIIAKEGWDQKVDIIKCGVGGWGPENAYRYLIKEGYKYHPDIVLFCFFTGNDFYDSLNPDKYVEYKGLRIYRSSRAKLSILRRIHLLGRKHSLFYGFVMDLGKWLLKGRKNPYPEDLFFLQNCKINLSEEIKKSRELAFRVMDKFNQWCLDSNVQFNVLVFPSRIEVDKTWRNKVISTYNLNASDFDLDLPTNEISNYLSHQKIQFYSFLEQPRELSRKGVPTHLILDSHYSKELHKELGMYLAEHLIEPLKHHNFHPRSPSPRGSTPTASQTHHP